MSVDYFLALHPPLPPATSLTDAFEDLGGAHGDWASTLSVGEVRIQPAGDDADIRHVLADALREREEKPVVPPLLFVVTGSEHLEVVAERLVAFSGGVLATEDAEIVCYARSAKKTPRVSAPPIDVSIPDDVASRFSAQQHYALCTRAPPTVKIPALVKKVQAERGKVGYPKYSSVSRLVLAIGNVHLSRYHEEEAAHWRGEMAALGLSVPDTLYRSSFAYWHVASVPEQEWMTMLAVVCGLARNTRAVLYRTDATAHHDFGP